MRQNVYRIPNIAPVEAGSTKNTHPLDNFTVVDHRFRVVDSMADAPGADKVLMLADDLEEPTAAPVVLAVTDATDKAAVARARREAFILENASHPHILSLVTHGVFTSPKGKELEFMVTPYIPGADLSDFRVTDADTAQQALQHVTDIASATIYLAEQGVVHGDQKPHNWLTDGTRTYLADFGLATPTPDAMATAHGTNLSVPRTALGVTLEHRLPLKHYHPKLSPSGDFAAPERVNEASEDVPSTPSEVFALCASAIQLFAGRRIWHDPDPTATPVERILRRELSARAKRALDSMPSNCRDVFLGGIDPDVNSRSQLNDVCDALRHEGLSPTLADL